MSWNYRVVRRHDGLVLCRVLNPGASHAEVVAYAGKPAIFEATHEAGEEGILKALRAAIADIENQSVLDLTRTGGLPEGTPTRG